MIVIRRMTSSVYARARPAHNPWGDGYGRSRRAKFRMHEELDARSTQNLGVNQQFGLLT